MELRLYAPLGLHDMHRETLHRGNRVLVVIKIYDIREILGWLGMSGAIQLLPYMPSWHR